MKNETTQIFPKARTEQLVLKEVDDEVLVYDLSNDKAHCLNKTAALVWRNCDGAKSIDEIVVSIQPETNSPVDERVVRLALDQLEKFQLLEGLVGKPAYLSGMSRRDLVRHLGVAAVALPAIMSIAAPTAQAVGSCGLTNAPCNPSDVPCCPGHTCPTSGTKKCT